MILKFKKIILHNFLSYSEAEFNLQNQGYCLIKGENHCKLDNALSNGSGKSAIINAISYVLCGETVQGVKNNLANILIPENNCWVTLELSVDDQEVKLTRYNKPKSDLKIFINNKDKSGKGIKESQEQLETLFPNITKEFISSTILLGQGLPDKLSSLSPSGRKELLEKLSKSDFMIQDIKDRLEKRRLFIDNKERTVQDNILRINTEQSLYNTRLEKIKEELQNLKNSNYDEEIFNLSNQLSSLETEVSKCNLNLKNEEILNDTHNTTLLDLTNKKQAKLLESFNLIQPEKEALENERSDIYIKYNTLYNEIEKLKNIKDICPTCRQKIPGVLKPDTTEKEIELQNLKNKQDNIDLKIKDLKSKLENEQDKVSKIFENDIKHTNSLIEAVKARILNHKQTLNTLLNCKQSTEYAYNKAILNKQNLLNNINKLEEENTNIVNSIKANNTQLEKLNDELKIVSEHEEVLKKINTLIKRDFRGYLLQNVIDYIDKKAKEYALEVFENDNIEFKLDGNNIDICFNTKYYESLSGGEKTRIDLIIQLALRNMLEVYLNYTSNVLFLDECLDFLDQKSSQAVLNFISKYSSNIDSVFIISHHSNELDIPIDEEILIIKNEEGISSIYQN